MISNRSFSQANLRGFRPVAFGGEAMGLLAPGRRGETTEELMIAEDRERMIELCRRIAMETDSKRLALWIEDLNQIIQRKIDELKKQRR